MNINFRIFRRNNKNLILLWNSEALTPKQKDNLVVLEMGESETERPLSYKRFVPDNPEKFADDVDGVVISHAQNSLDPVKSCVVKLVFGHLDDDGAFEVVKSVDPANSAPDKTASKEPTELRMYGMDYATGEWKPLPVDPKLTK